jgi:hypothetical protein
MFYKPQPGALKERTHEVQIYAVFFDGFRRRRCRCPRGR